MREAIACEAATTIEGTSTRRRLLADVPEDARVATEEVFGPALPIFRVGSLDEAIEKANNSIFGLGRRSGRMI